MQTVLAIDVGTTSIKAALINDSAKVLWTHRVVMIKNDSQLTQWHLAYWDSAFNEVFEQLPDREPDAIVISGNGPTLVPIGINGKAIDHVLLWLDEKSITQPPVSSFFLPKVLWQKMREPEVYESTSFYIGCPEYFSFLLGAEPCMVIPHNDFGKIIWDEEEINYLELDPEKFPKLALQGTEIGRVNREAAANYSIAPDIPIIAGGSDFLMSLLGTGAIEAGMTCDRAGTSEGINYCSSKPVEQKQLRTLPHVMEDHFNIAGILSSTGRMFEWFRRISGQSNRNYTEMIEDIMTCMDQEDLPWFFPSLTDEQAWEFNEGFFTNLRPHHGPREMGLAVLEALGFSLREAIAELRSAGCKIEKLVSCGGQAKNAPWTQMKADILGIPIQVPEITDAELNGCAILGFLGLGKFITIKEGVDQMVRYRPSYIPDHARHAFFKQRFEEYERRYEALKATIQGVI